MNPPRCQALLISLSHLCSTPPKRKTGGGSVSLSPETPTGLYPACIYACAQRIACARARMHSQIIKRMREVSAYGARRMRFNDKELGAWASAFSPDKEGLLEKKGAGRGQGERAAPSQPQQRKYLRCIST